MKIRWNGKQVTGAAIQSTRTSAASRVLEGKSVAQAVAAVPLLFSLCARAQVVVAAQACGLAEGRSVAPTIVARRELMVATECAHEYLWRLLVDLPPLLGEPAREREFAALRRRFSDVAGPVAASPRWWEQGIVATDAWCGLADEVEEFLNRKVFGMAIDGWLARGGDSWQNAGATDMARMLARLSREPAADRAGAVLPWLGKEQLVSDIAPALEASDAFAAAPTWQGKPAETGALARQSAHSRLRELAPNAIAARILARLVELAEFPARLRTLVRGEVRLPWLRGARLRAGVGIAAVETARGTLVHAVTLDGDRVARWRIVAPTEWNFHPAGAFVRGLAGLAAHSEDSVRRAATLLAHSLDPCVAFKIGIEHA